MFVTYGGTCVIAVFGSEMKALKVLPRLPAGGVVFGPANGWVNAPRARGGY